MDILKTQWGRQREGKREGEDEKKEGGRDRVRANLSPCILHTSHVRLLNLIDSFSGS